MYSYEEAKSNIARLVEDFHSKINLLKSNKYKEANIEDEYIKPMFKYLNWNTSSEGIDNKANREFVVQAQGKNGKEPDYLLKLEGKPCFYIEAKHPKYDLFNNTKYIWQAYSYAYSTQSSSARRKVDFSLLTDFEEFRFFDCTFKTEPKNVNNFTVIDWKYTDYIDKFQELWNLFERENVRNGSLNKLYLDEKKIKVNRIPPDKAFLSDLDDKKTGWRIILAKDIKKHNPSLSAEFITSVVQLVLDRFVFIKVLSDREIEDDFLAKIIAEIDKASLKSDEGLINDSCKVLFEKLNRTYNGSMFERRDELDYVKFSNKTLHSILKALLPENSRYNFKVMPVEILGTIYEQFLGQVVCTTDKRVTIELKPELKKANGVFYTPQYIVEYIVDNTVGSLLENCNSIDDLMKLKICDPACGSGSFLLGAYDKLINWTMDYYSNKITVGKELTKKERELFYQDHDGNIRLTAKIKRDILKSCIFGVDIDPQAVEVSKMSLSLKALEDTRHDELYYEVNLFNEAVLPNLSNNIKCGNSLIGTDYFDGIQFSIDEEFIEEKNVKPFNWEIEFFEIFQHGGFDIVIGNPPYGASLLEKDKKYFEQKYKTFEYQLNSFTFFIEKGLELLTKNGLISYIIPGVLYNQHYFSKIRLLIVSRTNIELLHLIKYRVFEQAETGDTLVFIFNNDKYINDASKTAVLRVSNFQNDFNNYIESKIIQNQFLSNSRYEFNSCQANALLSKIHLSSKPLKDLANCVMGIKPYQTGKGKPKQTKNIVEKRPFDSDKKLNSDYKPYIIGKDINRYKIVPIKQKFIKYGIWLAEPRLFAPFEKEKIVCRQTADHIIASLDINNYYNLNNVYNIISFSEEASNHFLLGLFNSILFKYLYYEIVGEKGRTFAEVKKVYLEKLPICINDSEIKTKIEANVKRILEANQKSSNSIIDSDKKAMLSIIERLDNQINQLVYKLYALTDEEIKIVEEA